MRVSKYATAYQKGIRLVDNAKVHINKRIILKLDIKDFFPSINFNMVYNTCFNETLYPKKIGIYDLIVIVRNLLKKYHFKLNYDKIRVLNSSKRPSSFIKYNN